MGVDVDSNLFVQRTANRLIEAVQSGDQAVIAIMRPLLTACYPSQLVQAITDGPILFALLVLVWLKPRKPGVVGAWFLGGYGLMRIATEGIRQPDVGVPLLSTPMGALSRGQVLSLLMVAMWLVAGLIVIRRDVEPIGGLKKSH
jgi:phosphatidylglycerol:prolipoprotein diacylglycerol transferase